MRLPNSDLAELLAPAGSLESLSAAINAGADAVYMGGHKYGARAYAQNADDEELLKALEEVHFHGRRLYLTINTLMREDELSGLYDFLKPLYQEGLDGVIVQDFGAAMLLKKEFPQLPLHASTQMTVTGPFAASLLKEWGIGRVVTARECSLDEIQQIKRKSGLEVEVFVHGSLCYCYSGMCLLSSLIGGRSGNRGRCAQPCRLPYQVAQKNDANGQFKNSVRGRNEEIYPLNLKDLQGLQWLPDLLEAGVDSFKIEGRMKSPRYTAGVVSVYRKYLDMAVNSPKSEYRIEDADLKLLRELYDRGGCTSRYFTMNNHQDMVALKGKRAFRQPDEALLSSIDHNYLNTECKEKINGKVTLFKDLPAKISITMCGSIPQNAFVYQGPVVAKAEKQPLAEASVKKQLMKLGGSGFIWNELKIEMEPDVFLPVSGLNELRREALSAFRKELTRPYQRKLPGQTEIRSIGLQAEMHGAISHKSSSLPPWISVLVSNQQQLFSLINKKEVSRIYLDISQISFSQLSELTLLCHDQGKQFYIAFPRIFRQESCHIFSRHEKDIKKAGVDGYLIRNIDELGFLKSCGWQGSIIGDHSLYAFNCFSKKHLLDQGIFTLTAPLELNYSQLKQLGLSHMEILVYGYLPAMVSAGCVAKTVGAASCDEKKALILIDRKKARFPVENNCRFCYNTIYNHVPLSLYGNAKEILSLQPSGIRLDFTIEDKAQVEKRLQAFINQFIYGKSFYDISFEQMEFTRGHFKRGVE